MKAAIFGLLVAMVAQAQTTTQDAREEVGPWRQQGSLVSIEIAKGQPLRFFVVGREEAKVDLKDVKLTVRRLRPYPGRVLNAQRSGDHFVLSEPLELNGPTDLEVTANVKEKVDVIKFKLPKQP